MPGFVICSVCATRIKAGRTHCLKCFEPLPPGGSSPEPSIFETLRWSRRSQLAAGTIAFLTVVVLLTVIWRTKAPQLDDVAHPAMTAANSAALPLSPGASDKSTVVAEVLPDTMRAGSEGDEAFFDAPRGTSPGGGVRDEQRLIHFKLAGTAVDRHEWTRAIAEYGAAASLGQDDPFVQYNFALALHRRGDEHDAIAAFHKAIALAPDQVHFHLALASAFENLGQIADAASEYRAFIEAAPHAAEADRARGRLEVLLMGNPRGTVPN